MTKAENEICIEVETNKEIPCPNKFEDKQPEKGMMILHTQDSGESWDVQLSGINDFLVDIQALRDGNLWAVGFTNGMVRGKLGSHLINHYYT